MRPLSFKRHRFPAEVIRHAVWLYFRFTLSFRDVEELLAQRGIEVSYETIRCWTIKFGPQIARNLKRRRTAPSPRWHLDEMVCTVGGKRMYLWRAVDDEGEVLDLVMQRRRDTDAALKLLKRLLRNQPVEPETITTDGLGSYVSALQKLGLQDRQQVSVFGGVVVSGHDFGLPPSQVGLEAGVPLYQRLNGPQLGRDWQINLALRYKL